MMSHTGYILVAFGLTAVVVGAMIALLVADHRALRRALARFPERGSEGEA